MGFLPFHEPSLPKTFKESIQKGNLKWVVGQTNRVISETDLTFIAVGTPKQDQMAAST